MKTRIFTLFYPSTLNTVSNNISIGRPSTVDPSGHFDYSYACAPQQKNPDSVKKWKVPGINSMTTVKPKIYKKKPLRRSENDHGGFHQQSPQRLDD